MKEVGILTFQNANNYGAVFQAFALQEVVKDLGANVKVINYDAPQMMLKRIQERRFNDFISEYLQLTEFGECINDINTSGFDVFLTGSDQIWNPQITRNDETYFLDFVKNGAKKVSYAASIGLNVELANNYRKIYEKYLPHYDGISLREESHVPFVKDIVGDGKQVIASMDPSVLLTAKHYEEKLSLRDVDEEQYIFVYSNRLEPKVFDLAHLLSLYMGYKLVITSMYDDYFFSKKAKVVKGNSPIEWMEYIRGAELVLTDSFHGIMYSMVFEKPFYAYTPLNTNVVRVTDVLKKVGFEDRKLTNIYNIKDIKFEQDYSFARKIIENERKCSYEYLQNSIDS